MQTIILLHICQKTCALHGQGPVIDFLAWLEDQADRALQFCFPLPEKGSCAKKHGGIKKLNKELRLDQNDIPFDFMTQEQWYALPYSLNQFIETIATFGDGSRAIMIKPEYQNNEKVAEMIRNAKQSYTDVDAERNANHNLQFTPVGSSKRQSIHKRSRGIKPDNCDKPRIAKSNRDYNSYVKGFIEDFAKENGLEKAYVLDTTRGYDDESGSMSFKPCYIMKDAHESPNFSKVYKTMMKYGYGLHEALPVEDAEGNEIDVYNTDAVFAKGSSVNLEGGRGSNGRIEYSRRSDNGNSVPKIGTTAFNNKK
jgi:hypothetical protein